MEHGLEHFPGFGRILERCRGGLLTQGSSSQDGLKLQAPKLPRQKVIGPGSKGAKDLFRVIAFPQRDYVGYALKDALERSRLELHVKKRGRVRALDLFLYPRTSSERGSMPFCFQGCIESGARYRIVRYHEEVEGRLFH